MTRPALLLRLGLPGLLAIAFSQAAAAAGPPLTVATWNLGWHQSQPEATQWLKACSQPFARNADGLWAPARDGERDGWSLKWGRDAKIVWDIRAMPPCDVFQARHRIVPPTAEALLKRRTQIADVLARQVQADVIAFQEVSGEAAVREVLPADGPFRGDDFHVCSFEGYGVQRLAFAWRKSLGGSPRDCTVEPALSLPARPNDERPRPGLALTLTLAGQRVHFLNVHLKSGCVSPLESGDANGRGRLDGADKACAILQDQVAPLEAWLEAHARDGRVVLLGDFNRQLWHESTRPAEEAARSPDGRVRNLLREMNDGEPAASRLTLLEESCPLSEATADACRRAAQSAAKDAVAALSEPRALGCRNPVGLDHILVSGGLPADAARKVPLGPRGRTQEARPPQHPDPLLAVSDHCPLVTRLTP